MAVAIVLHRRRERILALPLRFVLLGVEVVVGRVLKYRAVLGVLVPPRTVGLPRYGYVFSWPESRIER